MSRFALVLLLLQAAVQTPALPLQRPSNTSPAQPAPPQPPGNASPGQPSGNTSPAQPITPVDPAAATFATASGLLFVPVKPDKTTDYELVIQALQDLLSKTSDERLRAMAQGWRVYKAVDPDPKANTLYIHVIQPTVADADYRPSLLLDDLLAGASAELLAKYRDAIAGPPNKLGMAEFAHMAVAPVNASPSGPAANKSPDGPAVNKSPDGPAVNKSPVGPAVKKPPA